jgi:hypothetical protein
VVAPGEIHCPDCLNGLQALAERERQDRAAGILLT